MANEVALLANVLFSETKDVNDAQGIANVIMNRLKRPERFGDTLDKVVFAPSQFSGVGTNEWNKAVSRKFKNSKEENIYKSFVSIASRALKGQLEDNTGGADHYANLKISNPSWAKVYKNTAKIGEHSYFSEALTKRNAGRNRR